MKNLTKKSLVLLLAATMIILFIMPVTVSAAVDTQGPMVTYVGVTPNPVGINGLVIVTATIDDSTTGGSNIQSAEFAMKISDTVSLTGTMAAVDGTFDQVSEVVTATFQVPKTYGVYNLSVRGKDAADNYSESAYTSLSVFDTSGFALGDLTPHIVFSPVNTDQTVTVSISPPSPSVYIAFQITGVAYTQTLMRYTDASGTATLTYKNPNEGLQNIQAYIDVDGNGALNTGANTNEPKSNIIDIYWTANTGAQIKGYWQGTTGQGIIIGGATSKSGMASSGRWLRQYAPFQDLFAKATPSDVAAYVSDVMRASSGRGATVNDKLKAQMLATALNVYFSDSSLEGNKLDAPGPIGNVMIDLTKINAPLDSPTFEDTGSAFGRASSLTVSSKLSYASSQSNPGGSTWYGNNSFTEGLAKDAFQAINSQNAFNP